MKREPDYEKFDIGLYVRVTQRGVDAADAYNRARLNLGLDEGSVFFKEGNNQDDPQNESAIIRRVTSLHINPPPRRDQ